MVLQVGWTIVDLKLTCSHLSIAHYVQNYQMLGLSLSKVTLESMGATAAATACKMFPLFQQSGIAGCTFTPVV